MRTACRKDQNHAEVVTALEAAGALVVDVSGTACGCDLFVAFKGEWVAVEVKNGAKPPSARALTGREEFLMLTCKARGVPHVVALSAEDVLAVLP